MSAVRPEGAGGAEAAERAGELRAALEVFRHLDLGAQLAELLKRAVDWTGAEVGLAFGPEPDSRALVRLATTLPETDPRHVGFPRIDPALLPPEMLARDSVHKGLGALAGAGEAWPGPPPARSAVLPVAGLEAGTAVGVLLLLGDLASADGDLPRVRRLLDLARPAISNALLVRSVRDLVIKDDTAECYNRRYFDDFLVEELARAQRFRAALSLIFFDMDNLKQVNNRLGHAMGSRSLYEVSLRVRGRIRKFDKLFRFGGDEFCIVLPETEWHGALEVAERVRESIASRRVLTGEAYAGEGVFMTASFGIASFPLHARTREDLAQRADRAMQKIKNATKNSIAIAEIVKEDHGA